MLKSLALAALVSFSASAAHLDKVCETSRTVAWDKDLVAFRESGETLITTHEGTFIGSIPETALGIIQDGLSIWILSKSKLMEMNAAGEIMNDYLIEWTGNPAWQALSMAKADNMIVISRGVGGLLGFDLKTREIVWTNWFAGADEGQPSGLAFDGSKLFAALATSQENGFTGIAEINPMSGAVVKRTKYDVYRSGVIGTDTNARMHGDTFVLNNGGWLHLITKKQIEDGKAIRPRWAAHVIPASAPVNAHYMMLNGDFILHGEHVMGCGTYTAHEGGNFVRKSKLFHVKLP